MNERTSTPATGPTPAEPVPAKPSPRLPVLAAITIWLLVVLVTVVVTLTLPEFFASTARIRVEHDQTDIAGMATPATPASYDPYFMQTEAEILRSEVVLGQVVDFVTLKDDRGQESPLLETWGRRYNGGVKLTRAEALTWLKACLEVRPIRNTSIVEIRYSSERPDEAANLANAVAQTYLDHRIEQRKKLTYGGIQALKTRMEEESLHVREAISNVAYLRTSLRVVDPEPNNDVAHGNPGTAEALRRIAGLRAETKSQLLRDEALLNALRRLNSRDCAGAIPMALADSSLTPLLEQLSSVGQRLALLKSQTNVEAGEIANVSLQVEELKGRAAAQSAALLRGMEVKLAAGRKVMQGLDEEANEITRTAAEVESRSAPYWDAKRHLEDLRRIRALLLMKIANEKTDLYLPKSSMVEIVDPARPQQVPISPNKSSNIWWGILAGGLAGSLLGSIIYLLQRREVYRRTRGRNRDS